ncbi:MAG: hypothetical protein N6V49_13745, partial [Serratia symbiotica]|nr:hypothetical protein [Serratia symbiotica]
FVKTLALNFKPNNSPVHLNFSLITTAHYYYYYYYYYYVSMEDSRQHQNSKTNELPKFEVSVKSSKSGSFRGTKLNGT